MRIILIIVFLFSISIFSQNSKKDNDENYYYKMGSFYSKKHKKDSALYYFSKAHSFYSNKNDSINLSKTLLNIIIINYDTGFLDKAETNAIEALKIYQKPNKLKHKTYIYNILGNIYKKKKNFNEALNYHTKALTIRKKELKHQNLTLASLNNIALVYQESGNYYKAIEFLNEALKFDSIKIKKPTKYAQLIDNKAYNLFLADSLTTQILPLFKEALKIRTAKNNFAGLTINHLHLAEYYIKNKSFDTAFIHLKNAYEFAKKTDDNYTLLTILKKLSIVYPKNSSAYFEEYQHINNLVINAEREVKNIAAKIEYETEQKEAENLQLKNEKIAQTLQIEKEKTQKWLLSGGLGTSLITLVVFGYYYQKNKKQQLLIESLQKELHHRVKNNLGIIDTFIEVAKEEFSDKPFENKLTELQNRIASIHKIHEQLHINKDVTQLNLSNYITTLSATIKNSFSNNNISIIQKIDSNLQMYASKSFPIGLIINEFLTNSFKYAFDKNTKGTIEITITEDKKNYYISLKDNGKGLPTNFNINKISTFGLRIIKLLSDQLNGIFNLKNDNGVLLTILIPK